MSLATAYLEICLGLENAEIAVFCGKSKLPTAIVIC